jgi:hypothetical protein
VQVHGILEARQLSARDAFATNTLPATERIRTTLNFYDYAGQDPINGYDLNGACIVCILTAVAADTSWVRGLDVVAGGVLLGVGAYECYKHCGQIFHASGRTGDDRTVRDLLPGLNGGAARQIPGSIRNNPDLTLGQIKQGARTGQLPDGTTLPKSDFNKAKKILTGGRDKFKKKK